MDEIWKPVHGYEGRYEVSNLGQVRSLDRWVKYTTGAKHFHNGRLLRNQKGYRGYATVHLGYKQMNKYVHHLVMRAFVGKTPKGMEICHNDGDRWNNRLDNLRFDTRSSNMKDVLRHKYEQAWLNHAQDT